MVYGKPVALLPSDVITPMQAVSDDVRQEIVVDKKLRGVETGAWLVHCCKASCHNCAGKLLVRVGNGK